MINERKLISMNEAANYIDKEDETGKETIGFIRKFVKMKPEKAKELREKIEALNLMKIKEDCVAKILDILPETNEELNKIFVDVSLDEDESKKILETIKEFK